MSNQTDAPALDRLRQFEHDHRPSAGPERPAGSPGAQMATSIVLPGLPTIRRVPLLGVLLFTIGVAVPLVLAAWVFARRDDIEARRGQVETAEQHFRESLGLWRGVGNLGGVGVAIAGFAAVASGRGQPLRAARLLGAAEAIFRSIGCVLPAVDRLRVERTRAAVRAQIDAASFDLAYAEGQALAYDDAVALALEEAGVL